MTSSSGQIRLGGLSSGFDTESIVTQMLAIDQKQIDDLKDKEEINTAKIGTWEEVAAQLQSFADVLKSLEYDAASSSNIYDQKSVESNDTTVLDATANNSAEEAEYTVVVTALAQSETAYGSQKATNYTLPAAGSITLNGATINFSGGETLSQVAATITNASYQDGEGIIATIVDDRIVLQTKTPGTSSDIYGSTKSANFSMPGDDPNNILQTELGLIDGSGALNNISQAAVDAAMTVNGISVTSESNTVTDAIENVTLNLVSTGTATISIQKDIAELKEKVLDFVDLYNETRDLIERIRNIKVDETDEFGLLFSDPLLRSMFNEIRNLTTSGIIMGSTDWDGGQVSAAAAIGATQISANSFTAGTGTLDEGDYFTIAGDTTIYKVHNDSSITGNAATIDISPPLTAAIVGGEAISVTRRGLADFGVDVEEGSSSGISGILGVVDEGLLDSMLVSDPDLVKFIFSRQETDDSSRTGIAARLYDWVDQQTTVSISIVKNVRSMM